MHTFTTCCNVPTLIARFMGPTWGPSGADRTQVGPMLAHEPCYLARYHGIARLFRVLCISGACICLIMSKQAVCYFPILFRYAWTKHSGWRKCVFALVFISGTGIYQYMIVSRDIRTVLFADTIMSRRKCSVGYNLDLKLIQFVIKWRWTCFIWKYVVLSK